MSDNHAARELELYISNDSDLHRQQHAPILKNLATKKARGEYKHDLAVKLFGYLVEAGAKKYNKEFGTPDQPWHKVFDVATRREVAEELTDAFEGEAKLGNYDYLLPKKYQKASRDGAEGHRKKRAHSTLKKRASSTRHAKKITMLDLRRLGQRDAVRCGGQKSSAQLQREINEALGKKH